MRPRIPREFLWTDKETMDDFFELDPVNEEFFDVFQSLRKEPFTPSISPVKVFNEAYYQTTRMIYEHALPEDFRRYVADAKAKLGWRYSAALVMSMVYFMLKLTDRKRIKVNSFFLQIMFGDLAGDRYWVAFSVKYEQLKKKKVFLKYDFKPKPLSPTVLQSCYINWREITNNYSLDSIDHVIKLWNNSDDKRVIASLINDSVKTSNWPSSRFDNKWQIEEYLRKYLAEQNEIAPQMDMCCESYESPEETKLRDRIAEIEKEKQGLSNRINELEAENERLNALLEKKKKNGTARKFTLVEIAKYCKDCVEWNDAKSIVAMLNRLLRKTGTEEDCDLVDSIETEFKKRKYGDAVSGNKNSFGDYSNMVNFVLPENVDYDKLFKAIPSEIKDNWRKQLTQQDNG